MGDGAKEPAATYAPAGEPEGTGVECIVAPPLSEVLIGQVVLERLDLIADCTNRTLTPRYEDYPLLKLKALGTRPGRAPRTLGSRI
jgi:hypothetical protein